VDYEKVTSAKALVAYVGLASTGVGQEIEFAREDPKANEIKAIVLCDRSRLDGVSRLTLGSPVVDDQIIFDDPRQIEEPLRKWLIAIFSESNLRTVARDEKWHVSDLDRLVALFRQDLRAAALRGLDKPISRAQWKQKRKDLLRTY